MRGRTPYGCHPEERSDEGSAFPWRVAKSRSLASLGMTANGMTSPLRQATRRGGAGVAGVGRAGGLDQQQVHLFARNRPVLDAFWDDE